MSADNKRSGRQNRTKIAVRVVCIVMALLMVAGMAYSIFYILASSANAQSSYSTYSANGVMNTSALKEGDDELVSVGLLYGDDVEVEFGVRTSNGFVVGTQVLTGDKEFTPIWDLNVNALSCLSDANIAKANGIYSLASNSYDTYIGGYHVQIDCDDLNREGFEALMSMAEYYLSSMGLEVIPAYIYTGYAIRIGNFSTWEEASAYLNTVASMFGDRYVSVVYPTKTAVCVIDSYDNIIFEYDCGQNSVIGFKANPDENGNTYMMTPAGNTYDGVFAFKRYVDEDNNGVSLINILPLEAYVAGVLPYEISNSWPIEVQKEFALTVRSFTLTHLGSGAKHAEHGFDLCNTTCCEVYKGSARINDAVMEAVLGTRGDVMAYDGNIVTSYYSSTVGGVTVSAADCWGGKDVPYLQAIQTPWEDYMNHSNGFWMYEVTPTELLERMHKAGYKQLCDEIADVSIEELAKNSTYVKKLKVTDIYGTSITITYTDKVRTSLTPYVKSANFVVGRGSVEYTEEYVTPPSTGTSSVVTGGQTEQFDKAEGFVDSDEIYVLTSQSFDKIDFIGYLNIATGRGDISLTKRNVFTISNETAKAYIGDLYDEIVGEVADGETMQPSAPTVTDEGTVDGVTYKIAHADDPNNFIFVGKGWGHGVGMSQWGCYDLAVKGYKYDEIIRAYFPTVIIMNYRLTDNFKDK